MNPWSKWFLNKLLFEAQGSRNISLQNALYNEKSNREVVSFISQMKVDKNDPAIKTTIINP